MSSLPVNVTKPCLIFLLVLLSSACSDSNNIILAEHLKSCKPLEQKISYVIFGEEYSRSIKGLVNGNCQTIEQVPGNAKIECFYPEAKRLQIADFYLHPKRFEGAEIKQRTEFIDGNSVTRTTYIIDGTEVFHPLQDSYENGDCRTTVGSQK